MNIGEFFKLPGHKAFTYIFMILALILPGLSHLYFIDNSLNIPFLQLLLVSIVLSFPLFLLGLFNSIIIDVKKYVEDENLEFTTANVASLFSLVGTGIFVIIFILFPNLFDTDLIKSLYIIGLILTGINFIVFKIWK